MRAARLLPLLVLIMVAGCGTIAPIPPPALNNHVVYTVAQWDADRATYQTAVLGNDIPAATFYRNRMLWAVVADIDDSYYTFRSRFAGGIAIRHIAGDVL